MCHTRDRPTHEISASIACVAPTHGDVTSFVSVCLLITLHVRVQCRCLRQVVCSV